MKQQTLRKHVHVGIVLIFYGSPGSFMLPSCLGNHLNMGAMLYRICFSSFFLLTQVAFAQTVEESVQKVRDRYYRINGAGVSLTKQNFEDATYYFEDERIAIVKVPHAEGRYEYYYDYDDRSGYFPYFIYFASKNASQRPDLRLYYRDKMQLVLYKENQEEIALDMYNRPEMAGELLLQSMNYLHAYQNARIPRQQSYKSLMADIRQRITRLRPQIVRTDTISDNSYEEEGGGYDGEVHYYNASNELIRKQVYYGGGHGGEQQNYYYEDGQLIYSAEEKDLWAPMLLSVKALETFYKEGKAIVERSYESHGAASVHREENGEGDFNYNFELVVPKLKVLAAPDMPQTARYAGTYSVDYPLAPGGAAKLLIYPETDNSVLFYIYLNRGAPSHNMGEMYGRIEIDGQRAFMHRQLDFVDEPCHWEVVFGTEGTLTISSKYDERSCGFGFDVYADDDYTRISSDIPESFETYDGRKLYFDKKEQWTY